MLLGTRTKILKSQYKSLNWYAATKDQHLVVRNLLQRIVGREVLAAHSLTGNPSNAHPNKPAKPALDPVLVQDVVGKKPSPAFRVFSTIARAGGGLVRPP